MSNISKPKLFLADLSYVNKGKQWTIIPFPLNVSYMAAYIQKLFPDTFDIRIFKEPEKFLDAITNDFHILNLEETEDSLDDIGWHVNDDGRRWWSDQNNQVFGTENTGGASPWNVYKQTQSAYVL